MPSVAAQEFTYAEETCPARQYCCCNVPYVDGCCGILDGCDVFWWCRESIIIRGAFLGPEEFEGSEEEEAFGLGAYIAEKVSFPWDVECNIMASKP